MGKINETKFIADITNAYTNNIDNGIKYCEIEMQRIIEDCYGVIWWKVCTLSIYTELMQLNADPIFLADKILTNINENRK